MDAQSVGRALIAIGVVAVAAGLLVYFGGHRYLTFLGRLPGDIRIETENTKFYFPIATSILVSVVITLILVLISRFR